MDSLNLQNERHEDNKMINSKESESALNDQIRKIREKKIKLTAYTGIISKLLSMSLPLLTIKVTYDYLGSEVYGLWITLISFFSLFQFADLGLGNGMRQRLSIAYGADKLKDCKEIISSTYLMLWSSTIIISSLFLITFPFVDWVTFFSSNGTSSDIPLESVILAVVIAKLLNIPVSLVQRTQLSVQEGHKANLWVSFSYILSLVSVYIIASLDLGKMILIWTSSLIIVIVSVINMIVYFKIEKPEFSPKIKYVNLETVKYLFSTGLTFFILSILTTVGLSMDNFIVGKISSFEEVSNYAILAKVTLLIGGVTTMLSAPLWAANGEAIAKKDWVWLKNNTKKMSMYLVLLSLSASLVLFLVAKPAFSIWLGDEFSVSNYQLTGFLFMQVLLSYATSYFMVLNAFGFIKHQILMFGIYTPIGFVAKYLLGEIFGINIIPWIGSILYLFFIVIPLIIIVRKIYNDNLIDKEVA